MTGLEGFGLAVAFAGGVVSFASPCCLPLVPAYVSYMLGAAGEADRRRAFLHGLAFVAGFSVVFVAFWASIGAVGYVLADNKKYLAQLGGALLIFLGLHTAGVINIPVLWRDTRPMPAFGGGALALSDGPGAVAATTVQTPSYGRSLLFGTLFAAGWSPCIGPILGGIIGLASATATVAQGTLLLISYAAGLAVPFLAVAVGANQVAARLAWVGRHHRAVSLVTGALLVGIGALMVTNTFSRLASFTAPLGG
ncbi:MAG TPA: cytochrome c biogenesis protein CcdA [Candidatus Dormibacteraeota bacterium]|nr:cytochrome c biogenesis protein CcdA [Candidatus Dormibacteraeota bacterium]